MAAPIALFNFRPTALAVQFEDLTTNIPTSWSWNFGDASPVDVTQNPSHTYAADGMYKVILTATNADGSSIFSYWIIVTSEVRLSQTIETMVRSVLPSDYVISEIDLTQAVMRWQMYLQPKVYIPYVVTEADTFDQTKWPSLANVLISKLIVYEMFLNSSKRTIISSSGSSSGSSTTTTGGVVGAIKKIESGPSVAEWFNPATTISQTFSSSSRNSDGTAGGMVGMMAIDICLFAKRQNIALPDICTKKKIYIPFGIAKIPPPTYE